MDHIKAVIARRIKFILEKQSFISFAFNTRKGKNKKLHKSIFPSKKKLIPEINRFLTKYFKEEINKLQTINESSCYDEYFKKLINDLYSKLRKKGLCNNFKKNTAIFWSYFTKAVNIMIYDLVTHNELVETSKFNRIKWLIHVPIDNKVISEARKRIRDLESTVAEEMERELAFFKRLDSINSEELYDKTQKIIRKIQKFRHEPPIYIEDAYSLT